MSRFKRATAAATIALAACTTGLLGGGTANAVTGGSYCGPTSQVAGDVYVQACLSVSGTTVSSYLHMTNNGSHSISGTTWTNSGGTYSGYNSCGGNFGLCYGGSVYIGSGGYAQGQGTLTVDGVTYGKFFSPTEYIG
jgi:hypothetical protein